MTELQVSDWPVHPAAEMFPMLSGPELRSLADDIEENGLRNPVVLWREPSGRLVLIDGRNRVAACREAKKPVRWEFYEGDDPISFVISTNLHRRHLTAGQKADIAVRAEGLMEEQEAAGRRAMALAGVEGAKKRWGEANGPHPMEALEGSEESPKRNPQSRDKVAALVGTSGRAVTKMKRIAKERPDLQEKIRSGEMSLHEADDIIAASVAPPAREKPAISSASAQRHALDKAIVALSGIVFGLNQITEIHPQITNEEAAEWIDGLSKARRAIDSLINRLRGV